MTAETPNQMKTTKQLLEKIEVDVFGMPTCLCEVDGGCDDVEVRKGGCLCQLCTGHDGTALMS